MGQRPIHPVRQTQEKANGAEDNGPQEFAVFLVIDQCGVQEVNAPCEEEEHEHLRKSAGGILQEQIAEDHRQAGEPAMVVSNILRST